MEQPTGNGGPLPTKGLRSKRRVFLYRFRQGRNLYLSRTFEYTTYTGNFSSRLLQQVTLFLVVNNIEQILLGLNQPD